MARIHLLEKWPGYDVPDNSVVVFDREDASRSAVLDFPNMALALLRQIVPPMPEGMTYPAGSLGQLMQSGLSTGLAEWYQITSFTHDQADVVEQGNIVVDAVLSWTYDFPTEEVLAQEITGPGGPINPDPGELTVTMEGVNLGTTAVWTLHVTTPFGVVTEECELAFGYKVYYGRGSITTLTEAQVEALATSYVAPAKPTQFSFEANAGAGAYLWIAWPSEFGTIAPMVDASTLLPVEFVAGTPITVTNAYGIGRTYHLYRSVNTINAAITVDSVW